MTVTGGQLGGEAELDAGAAHSVLPVVSLAASR